MKRTQTAHSQQRSQMPPPAQSSAALQLVTQLKQVMQIGQEVGQPQLMMMLSSN